MVVRIGGEGGWWSKDIEGEESDEEIGSIARVIKGQLGVKWAARGYHPLRIRQKIRQLISAAALRRSSSLRLTFNNLKNTDKVKISFDMLPHHHFRAHHVPLCFLFVFMFSVWRRRQLAVHQNVFPFIFTTIICGWVCGHLANGCISNPSWWVFGQVFTTRL